MRDSSGEGRLGISILGSTGSIGRQTLAVIDAHPERFRVVALAARTPSRRFQDQVAKYSPEIAVIAEQPAAAASVGGFAIGAEGLIAASTLPSADIVVVASSGHAAIEPTIRAIARGKIIALANKETLVCAGEIIVPTAAASAASIRPVDSEHSAIWQALGQSSAAEVSRIILTASGGPFRSTSLEDLARVTAREALAHPTWSMGGKITIDSATLMNKGLEIIEAHWLFDLPYDRIDIVVHPQSIVHSLVEFVDGGLIAQLGVPDMRLPIQYALTYPRRLPVSGQRLDLAQIGALQFEQPDEQRFPALQLAREAGIAGATYPTVLSAADDEAVSAFLAGALRFVDIPTVVRRALEAHHPAPAVTLEAIASVDVWARAAAKAAIARMRER